MDIDLCRSMYKSYTEVNGREFPMMIGKSVRWESWAPVNLPSGTRVAGKLACRTGVSFSRFTGKRQASERGLRDTRDVGRRRKERKEGRCLSPSRLSFALRPPVRVSLTEQPVNSELT